LRTTLGPGQKDRVLVAIVRNQHPLTTTIKVSLGVPRMRMLTEALTLMRLLGVASVAVQVEMDEWRVAKGPVYGEAQIQCERALHERGLYHGRVAPARFAPSTRTARYRRRPVGAA
jgi:hypothetical protein